MACSRAHFVQDGPVCTGMPLSTYSRRRVAAKCWTASGRGLRVPRCLEAMKAVRKGGCVNYSAVDCDMYGRVSALGSTGGG